MYDEENVEELHIPEANCIAKAEQAATVCVPVTVTPFANVGKIMTDWCGKPVVSFKNKPCRGVENGSCKFTISQRIKVQIPVEFGANTTIGGTFVECECVPHEDEEHEHHME